MKCDDEEVFINGYTLYKTAYIIFVYPLVADVML